MSSRSGASVSNEFALARILVLDDSGATVETLVQLLADGGYERVSGYTEPAGALRECVESAPDLVLLDLIMPEIDGLEVLGRLRQMFGGAWPPVIVLTADTSTLSKHRALELGARDFLTKPFDSVEVLLRVRNVLEARLLHRRLEEVNTSLDETVQERTAELGEARLEILERLVTVAEYRDNDTGVHARRVGLIAASLIESVGSSAEEATLVSHAATPHDIGKVGVPDRILLKPGKLTAEEFAVMQRHTTIGAEILSGSDSRLLQIAEQIARSHHERWDGEGYPAGLAGEEIPLVARATAVADVFDALTRDRPYRGAWVPDDAIAQIERESGSHFDPALASAFLEYTDRFVELIDSEPAPRHLGAAS